MTKLKILLAGILTVALFIAHKPSDHEHLAESPTERYTEIVPYVNPFNAIYTHYLEKERQLASLERKIKREQSLAEAHRLYDAKIAQEQRKKVLEQQLIEANRLAEKKRTEQKQISRSIDAKLRQITMIATHYTSRCDGCSGVTAAGIDVKDTIYTNGLRIIAVDPKAISLGSIVRVEYADGTSFKAIAGDVGGAIKNRRIDVLVASESEAYRLGKQTVTVTILNNGKER